MGAKFCGQPQRFYNRMTPAAQQFYDELCSVAQRYMQEADLEVLEAVGALETLKLELFNETWDSTQNDEEDPA